jgi:hypothetical protein
MSDVSEKAAVRLEASVFTTQTFRHRLALAWIALRGQLRGGIYISPRDLQKSKVVFESCEIESRVGKDTSLLSFSPRWNDVKTRDGGAA